jgi:hypothetical protein
MNFKSINLRINKTIILNKAIDLRKNRTNISYYSTMSDGITLKKSDFDFSSFYEKYRTYLPNN